MSTQDYLHEVHERVHRNLATLLDHCETLPEGSIDKEMEGFGYETIRLQIHHMLGAEEYWVGVIQGDFNADDDDHLYPTIDSLKQYREQVFQMGHDWLESASEDELLTARSMDTWGGKQKVMTPAHIFMRTQTHMYHHKGQVVAMCRLLGHPCSGTDYPIE